MCSLLKALIKSLSDINQKEMQCEVQVTLRMP